MCWGMCAKTFPSVSRVILLRKEPLLGFLIPACDLHCWPIETFSSLLFSSLLLSCLLLSSLVFSSLHLSFKCVLFCLVLSCLVSSCLLFWLIFFLSYLVLPFLLMSLLVFSLSTAPTRSSSTSSPSPIHSNTKVRSPRQFVFVLYCVVLSCVCLCLSIVNCYRYCLFVSLFLLFGNSATPLAF